MGGVFVGSSIMIARQRHSLDWKTYLAILVQERHLTLLLVWALLLTGALILYDSNVALLVRGLAGEDGRRRGTVEVHVGSLRGQGGDGVVVTSSVDSSVLLVGRNVGRHVGYVGSVLCGGSGCVML